MSGPGEQDGPTYLAVTNKSDEPITARFHGQDYGWDAGETCNISVDAARHIFGFGQDDKAPAFHRLGWLNTRREGTPKHAAARLAQVSFAPVRQVFELPRIGQAPRRGKQKASGERSPADAGESTGGLDDGLPDAPDAVSEA